jgi:shikimate kinase
MGAGKTTVGRELAARLRWKFVDLDDVVVEEAGKPVPQIFAEHGEVAFREHEHRALVRVLNNVPQSPMVIALGGGAFVQPANAEVILRSAISTVFLDAGVDTLLLRCHRERKVRPLAQNENQFRQLYEQRQNGYMKAEHRVETAGKAVREIVTEIVSRLGWSDEVFEVQQTR